MTRAPMSCAKLLLLRRRYHLMWAVKYWLVALLCFAGSLYAWPRRSGLIALAVGYVFAGLGSRERRRAHAVLPW